MLNLTAYGRLTEYTKLTDKITGEASKDALAQAARMHRRRLDQRTYAEQNLMKPQQHEI